MTTAFVLTAALLAIAGGYAWWALQAIAAGAAAWPFIVGAAALPFAIPLVFTIVWFALAWAFGTPLPPGSRLGFGRLLALFWNEWQAIRHSGPRMILYRWLTPDPAPGPSQDRCSRTGASRGAASRSAQSPAIAVTASPSAAVSFAVRADVPGAAAACTTSAAVGAR